MKTDRAAHDLATIRQRLQLIDARASFRCFSLFASSAIFVLAALCQPVPVNSPGSMGQFVGYWTLVGLGCCCAIAFEVWIRTVSSRSRITLEWSRRLSRAMLPSLAAAALITCALLNQPQLVTIMPGLWAMLGGLAVASCSSLLPRSSQLPALWMIAGGAVALRFNADIANHLPLAMILLFAVGQSMLACSLFVGGQQHGRN